LWTSDGTGDGTVLVADILPGSDGSFGVYGFGNSQHQLFNMEGTLYFAAYNGVNGEELWKVAPLPVPTDSATLDDSGNLIVSTTVPPGQTSTLTLSLNNGNLRLHNLNRPLAALTGTMSLDQNTAEVSLDDITGQIVINGDDGDGT